MLVALVSWLLMPPKKQGSWLRQPSSFFNTGSGSKVAYLVLDRLGYRVTQIRRPLSQESLEDVDALVILEPIVGLEKGERKALGDWIEAGHVLVVAPGVRGLGVGIAPPGVWFFDNWFSIGPPATRVSEPQGLIPALVGSEMNSNDTLAAGVRELVCRGEFRFPFTGSLKGPLVGSPLDEIWKDDYGLVAMRVHYGDGRIIALADTHWLSNRGIDDVDNGLFWANIARECAGGRRSATIAFDEIHHGFAMRDDAWLAILKLMLAEHWGWGLIQAGLVVVLALFASGVRFGKPRDLVLPQRRFHGEFAEAAGRTLHDAGANNLAYRTLYHHYRTHLCRIVRLDSQCDDDTLSRAVAAARGLQIRPLLDESDRKVASGRASRLDVLQLATQFHQVQQELEHAT